MILAIFHVAVFVKKFFDQVLPSDFDSFETCNLRLGISYKIFLKSLSAYQNIEFYC